MALKPEQITRLAILELNALALTRVLPASLEKAKIADAGTPVYDPNGTLLFHRVPIMRGRVSIGYADISAQEALGEPLLAVSTGQAWNEKAIVREATTAARRIQRALVFDDIRFVAYSFPKVAVQFLNRGEEVLLLEWRTWAVVPPAVRSERNPLEPGHFERWSLLDEMPAADKRRKTTEFKKRPSSCRACSCPWWKPARCATLRARRTTRPATNCAASRPGCGAWRPAPRCCSTSTATTTTSRGWPRNWGWAPATIPTACPTPR